MTTSLGYCDRSTVRRLTLVGMYTTSRFGVLEEVRNLGSHGHHVVGRPVGYFRAALFPQRPNVALRRTFAGRPFLATTVAEPGRRAVRASVSIILASPCRPLTLSFLPPYAPSAASSSSPAPASPPKAGSRRSATSKPASGSTSMPPSSQRLTPLNAIPRWFGAGTNGGARW